MRRRIARLRHLDPRSGPTTIDVAQVRAIEDTLSCVLDDEALALLASGVADLTKDAGMDVARVVERTRTARARGAPAELIAIGGQPSGLEFYCVEAHRAEEGPLLLIEFVCADRSLTGRPIVEWVEGRLEARREVLLNSDDSEERKLGAKQTTVAEIALFQPSLVTVATNDKPAARRVRHPTFGEGEVLSEIAAGESKKLSVRFESGTKLLLERVLEYVDG